MNAINDLLNRINEWNDPEQSAFKRHVGTRLTNLLVTVPNQALIVAKNILITPVLCVGVAINLGSKVIGEISGSQAVKDFHTNLPNVIDLVQTIAKIVVYAIGTIFTATLGILSPTANFKVQCALSIAVDRREELIKIAMLDAEIERLTQIINKKEAFAEPDEDENCSEIIEETCFLTADPKDIISKIEHELQKEPYFSL